MNVRDGEKSADLKVQLKCGMPFSTNFINCLLTVGQFALENFKYKNKYV